MGILEEMSGGEPVNINEMFAKQEANYRIPESTARNEAATTALLVSKPEDVIQTYQGLNADLQQGNKQSTEMLIAPVQERYRARTQEALSGIFGDTSIPFGRKQAALDYVSKSNPTSVEMYSNHLAAVEPQGNEEQKYVITSTRSKLASELSVMDARQKIFNEHAAKGDTSMQSMLQDFSSFLIPGYSTAQSATVLTKIQKEMGMNPGFFDRILYARGKSNILDALNKMPPEERKITLGRVADTISENSGVLLQKNDMAALEMLQSMVEKNDDYGLLHKGVDTAFQLLDAVGLFGIAKSLIRGAKAIVTRTPAPVSPFGIATSASPDVARSQYGAIVSSEGDEVAKALTGGLSREEVILHTESPQLLDSSVEAKLINPYRDVPIEIREAATGSPKRLTDNEITMAMDKSKEDFKNAMGTSVYDNHTQIGIDGDAVVYRGVFGTSSSGWKDAQSALDTFRYQFRNFELDDDLIGLLKRDVDGNYNPIQLKDAMKEEGDYLVEYKIKQTLNPESYDSLSVKRNWLDRLKFSQSRFTGSAASNVMDWSSMLDRTITSSTVNAVDRSIKLDKIIIKMGDDFATTARALPKDQQKFLGIAIQDSNFNRVEYSPIELKTKFNLSDDAVKAMSQWRRGWDAQHYLANITAIKRERNAGNLLLDNGTARIIAKPISQNSKLGKIYDAATDSVRELSEQEVKDLYAKGGTLAKLKSPEKILGETVTHMAVENKPTNYLRALSDTDQLLNYIPGYYKLYYKAPVFVRMYDKADGVVFSRAIAVAGDSKEATHFLERKAAQAGVPTEKYGFISQDVKAYGLGDEIDWELSKSAGGVNQRHRGVLLENSDSTAPVHLGQTDYIVDPTESFTRSASNIANKVAMQDVIDTSKRRLMEQYSDLLPKDKHYPSSYSEIGYKGMIGKDASRAADARTLWAYIDAQESGYINALDEGSKAIFKTLAGQAGEMGISKLERLLLKVGEMNPIQQTGNLVHEVFIKMAPQRQWITQTAQTYQLASYNPAALVRASKDTITFSGAVMKQNVGKSLTKEEGEILSFIKGWGALDGVDRQALVDGPLRELSRNSNTIMRGIGKTLNLPGKIGFDPAEKANLLLHALTVRQNAIGKGLNVFDKNVIDDIYAEARALTLDMNTAGDMPYNKTALSFAFKFLQIPHKSLLRITTNRRLDLDKKLQIAAGDALLFGIPVATIGSLMDKDTLPDDPKMREMVQFGALTYGYNAAWREIGQNSDYDLSSLGPYETSGWKKLLYAFYKTDMASVVASTPVGGLFFGANPRITNVFKKASQWMGIGDYVESPVEFKDVVKSFVSISSGMSNGFKAMYIHETGKELDKKGVVLHEGLNNIDALHALFGFTKTDQALMWKNIIDYTEDKKDKEKKIKGDVAYLLNSIKEKYGMSVDNIDSFNKTMSELNRIYAKDPQALAMAHKEVINLGQTNESWFFNAYVEWAGIYSYEQQRIRLKASGMKEEQIQKLIEVGRLAHEGDAVINKTFKEVYK